MSEQEVFQANLKKLLEDQRPYFNMGICNDPLLYTILQLIENADHEAYDRGYEDGYLEGRYDERVVTFDTD